MEPNNAKKMILNLSSGEAVRPVSPGKSSPIPQMDGVEDMDNDTVTYTFQSEYAEEDIIETLDEIFSDKKAAETGVQSKSRTLYCCAWGLSVDSTTF